MPAGPLMVGRAVIAVSSHFRSSRSCRTADLVGGGPLTHRVWSLRVLDVAGRELGGAAHTGDKGPCPQPCWRGNSELPCKWGTRTESRQGPQWCRSFHQAMRSASGCEVGRIAVRSRPRTLVRYLLGPAYPAQSPNRTCTSGPSQSGSQRNLFPEGRAVLGNRCLHIRCLGWVTGRLTSASTVGSDRDTAESGSSPRGRPRTHPTRTTPGRPVGRTA